VKTHLARPSVGRLSPDTALEAPDGSLLRLLSLSNPQRFGREMGDGEQEMGVDLKNEDSPP
jgi:hypothetical protein